MTKPAGLDYQDNIVTDRVEEIVKEEDRNVASYLFLRSLDLNGLDVEIVEDMMDDAVEDKDESPYEIGDLLASLEDKTQWLDKAFASLIQEKMETEQRIGNIIDAMNLIDELPKG